jgi:hypothetical protein
MRVLSLTAAATLLLPLVPTTPAIAAPPQSGDNFCAVFGGAETCYFETRAECEYARAKEQNAFRDDGLSVEQCRPVDDPEIEYILGVEWQFDASF